MKNEIAVIDSSALGIIAKAEAQIREITGNPVALVAYQTK